MRVMSTFSGISAASVAWKPLGWEFVAYAEPSVFPAHVLHHRCNTTHPRYIPKVSDFRKEWSKYIEIKGGEVVNFGDITQISDSDLEALGHVDVLEGGSPCQAFSIAGLRQGLDDDRGNLTLAFVDLALRMRRINGLRFVVWENVRDVLNHHHNPFGCLLGALSDNQEPLVVPGNKWSNSGFVASPTVRIAWVVKDAQYFFLSKGDGLLPQRRKRVFLIASFDDRVDPGEVLFEPESEGWTAGADEASWEETRPTRSGDFGIIRAISMDSQATIDDEGIAYALKASNGHNPQCVIHPLTVGTLMTSSGGTKHLDIEHTIITDDGHAYAVRRLMPVECERLQGFPDNWTNIVFKGKPASDVPRYKACGNSMAVPCMSWLGRRLAQHAS